MNVWFVCSTTKPLTILSLTANKITVLIPPYTSDTICIVNATTSTTYTRFKWEYSNSSTCSISLTCSGLSCTYVKNNLTSYNVDKA